MQAANDTKLVDDNFHTSEERSSIFSPKFMIYVVVQQFKYSMRVEFVKPIARPTES